jgi:tetratricopeptide (TPR) repeat protein
MMPGQPHNPPSVFVSYAREDEPYKHELIKQLNVLETQGVISSWHDGLLVAGEQWNETIVKEVNAARIILLLVSPDFMNSQYIRNVEMKRASERYEAGEVTVIPVLVRNVNSWQNAPFGDIKLGALNALPVGAKFVSHWSNQDDAFANVAKGIQEAAEKLSELVESKSPSAFIPRAPVFGFVARRDERGDDIVERLKEELAPHENQFVTLSGPGGIGKTTLAAEAARALKDEFAGRVVWSSAEKRVFQLSTLLDDTATQLGSEGLRTLAPDLKAAHVLALVADRPALIILDNYETIVPEAKQSIEEWFAHAQCSALFTSRHRINQTRNINIDAMSREEAEEYLEKLVTDTQDAQMFSEETRQRIYQTAAANPYVMQWVVGQIDAAEEPRMVFDDLAHGKGDAAQRVFDRSFNLEQLGDDGRAALLALSLFVPSATREALASVAGFGDELQRVNEAIKNLRALWLIKAIDENRCFTIESLTRTLAVARLSKDPRADEFRQRFVAHFLSFADSHAQPTPEDFDMLEVEKDNLLNAIDVAFDLKNWKSVILLMAAINSYGAYGMLSTRGYWDAAIRYGEQALEAAKLVPDKWSIGAFANGLGIMFAAQGDYSSAREHYELAVDIARQLDEKRGMAATLHELGRLAQDQGELEEARRLYDESLEITKKLGDQEGIASTLHQLAMIAENQGELEETRRLYNKSLEIEKRLGRQSGIAITLHNLAAIAQNQGELEEARRLYDESLEIKKRLGDQRGIAITLHELGRLAQSQGELEEARRLYDESLEIARRLGDQEGIASTLYELGRLADKEGNRQEAMRLFRESLGIFERLKSPYAEIARGNLKRLGAEDS